MRKQLNKQWLLTLALVIALLTGGCGGAANTSAKGLAAQTEVQTETHAEIQTDTVAETAAESTTETQKQTEAQDEAPTVSASKTNISLADIPAYDDQPYTIINGNQPFFDDSELTTTPFETYSNLDSLGRCGVAYANVCIDIMPTEKRGEIGSVRPSGWHTVKYNDIIDGNYLYNRCHLVGYQLAGENANEKNLITGTRYLNVTGMLPFENEVDDYVEASDNHVLYRVTPIYDGDNLVASGVLMEAKSVEDNGDGICFNIYCYNVQPGIIIDYATGESHEADSTSDSDDTSKTVSAAAAETNAAETIITETEAPDKSSGTTYILNTNTKKFHLPSCSSVDQMSEKNKKESNESRDTIISEGYDPCKRCNP